MRTNDATILQIERFIRKIAQKFPSVDEPTIMTDIHLSISQDSGEFLAFDDNDKEITRCVVNEWIDSREPDFYDMAAGVMRNVIGRMHDVVGNMGILKPFSFILETDEREHYSELYLVDSDIRIIGGDLMKGLDDDLDKFLDDLLKES